MKKGKSKKTKDDEVNGQGEKGEGALAPHGALCYVC